jgi:hypothetical protein
MTKHKPILLDEETYNRISKLARDNGRTRAGQVRIMADAFELLGIQSVTQLPKPSGATTVPVVNVYSEREAENGKY